MLRKLQSIFDNLPLLKKPTPSRGIPQQSVNLTDVVSAEPDVLLKDFSPQTPRNPVLVKELRDKNTGNPVLLKELSESDINWMMTNGHQQQVPSGTVILQQQSKVDNLYIILEGTLGATISRNRESTLASVFAALEEDDDLEQEIARFFSGEILGEMSFLNISPSATTVKAIEHSVILVLPCQNLLVKLRQDLEFASRFYRAIAILLLDRFERLVKDFIHRQNLKIPPLQDVPLIFGELSDSDVDWLVETGIIEELTVDTVLIQAGRSVENLYVVLEGSISVFFEDKGNDLAQVFAMLENQEEPDESPGTEIAQATKGEIIGEMALIDARLPAYTFKALDDLRVLAIDRKQLFIKLQQNPGMGARFHRAIAMLLSARLQGLISRLGYGRSAYRIGQTLSQEFAYDDEIDLEVMDNLTLGGARFDWMLKRLRTLS
jgi:CRP-like cAMP-binding protein